LEALLNQVSDWKKRLRSLFGKSESDPVKRSIYELARTPLIARGLGGREGTELRDRYVVKWGAERKLSDIKFLVE